MKHLGHELYKIIEDKRLVKKEIAEKIDINPTYFSQLMNRESFAPETLEKICKAVGVSPAYFFDDWSEDRCLVGEVNNQSIIGNATVNVGNDVAHLEALIKEKDRIIEEKERLIRVLLQQSGMSGIVDCM